jgi:hypothetical protein
LGMNKGGIILLHMTQIDRVFCRFTIHRNSVLQIMYLDKAKVFVSYSSD